MRAAEEVTSAVPVPARIALAIAVALLAGALAAACSYDAGELDSSATTAPRTTLSAPPTTQFTLVGTLPLLPGQAAVPAVTVPEYTIPVDTTAAPTASSPPAPATTAPTSATTAAASTATTKAPILGVQAGAYSSKKTAEMGLSTLAEKGFPGFAVVGQKPYKLIKQPLSRAAADALVAALAKAGWPALVAVVG